MLKVFGHKSPDTDTVLSAIVYAWYLTNIEKKEAKAFINGEPNNETMFLLKHFQVELPDQLALEAGDEVVIVDTNNPEELPSNLSEMKIVEIVDHHKMAGLFTPGPLNVTIRPLASTTSIIFSYFLKRQTEGIDKKMLGLIFSAILSDTLEFRSPITTPVDKENAELLATYLGISIPEFAKEMFTAKSDISKYSAKELLLLDSKVYQIKGKNLRIATLETTDPAVALAQKEVLKNEMVQMRQVEELDEVLFFVVDILNEEAHAIIATESGKALIAEAFGKSIDGDSVVLPGVLSRKKQIIPALEK